MAVPKGRSSKKRGRTRRAHIKMATPNLVECPQCHELRVSHRVCKNCGYYNGREAVTLTEEE